MRLEVPRRGLDPGPCERIAAHVLAQRGVHCLGRVELPTGEPRGEDAGDEIASAAQRLLRVERQLVRGRFAVAHVRSEEHTSELQSRLHLVCRLLLDKKNHTTAMLFPLLLLSCLMTKSRAFSDYSAAPRNPSRPRSIGVGLR